VVLEIRVDHRLVRLRRMQIDRHVELLGALEDRPEELLVQETALAQAHEHRALEAELGHRALKLVGGRLGVRHRQRREAGEARRVLADLFVQIVIGTAGQWDRLVGIELVHCRRGLREHLHVDAGRIHLADA
jgi:hypothetical protein